ncbi:hypothetical protein BJ944DRAFT_259130 [Cunninghamella echinulata]|nr:hypothetical protein BJ944DRAFT_259130 [Cunninghamella echinulata]
MPSSQPTTPTKSSITELQHHINTFEKKIKLLTNLRYPVRTRLIAMIYENIINDQIDVNKIYDSIDIILLKDENSTVKQIFSETFGLSKKDNQNSASMSNNQVLDRRKSTRIRLKASKANGDGHTTRDHTPENENEISTDNESFSTTSISREQSIEGKNKKDYYSEFDIDRFNLDEFDNGIKMSSIRLSTMRKPPPPSKTAITTTTATAASPQPGTKRKRDTSTTTLEPIQNRDQHHDNNKKIARDDVSTTILLMDDYKPSLLLNDDSDFLQPLVFQHQQQLQHEQDLSLEELSLRYFLYNGHSPFILKVYQHINHLDTYKSFLELVDLYDQQLLDQQLFITHATPFLSGNSSLFEEFKYGILSTRRKKKDRSLSSLPSSVITDTATTTPTATTMNQEISNPSEKNTPSYRQIPKSWQNQTYSGRDEICWEVLNDEYASHPTWASEDNGFLLTKKNKFEESIHLVEEERYALDVELNEVVDSIRILKIMAKRLDHIPSEDLQNSKLLYEFEKTSNTVYIKLMDQLCSKSKRMKILDLFRKYSTNTLNELIQILEQKVKELKKTRHERRSAWKNTVEKNYYKSLDHQWVNYKSEIRKQLSQQNLLTEITALWHEKHLPHSTSALLNNNSDDSVFLSPVPQFEFEFSDTSIIEDVMQLMIISYSSQLNYGIKDTTLAEQYIQYRLSTILGSPSLITNDKDNQYHHHNVPFHPPRIENKAAIQPYQHYHKSTFIGNTPYYYLFRYFQMVYEMLSLLKSLGNQYQDQPEATKTLITASIDLKLEKKFISGVEYDYSNGYYNTGLNLMKTFVKGQIDQVTFEDEMRYIFGIQAFRTFNLHRIQLYMSRQLHQIINGPYSSELFDLYIKNQEHTQNLENKNALTAYRRSVGYVFDYNINNNNNEKIFMIRIDNIKGVLYLYLLNEEELLYAYEAKRFETYLNTYQDPNNDTYGVDQRQLSPVYLKRNLPKKIHHLDSMKKGNHHYIQQDLSYRFFYQSYRMYYVNNTEDIYIKLT